MTHIQNRNWLLVIGHRLSVVGENQTPDTKNLRPLKSWLKLILLSYILIIALLFNLTPLVLAEQILTGEKPKRQTRRKITADSLKWEYEKGIAIFSGNVTMNGEEGEITSSKMTVFFDDKDQIEKIIGEGTVNLIREKQKVNAQPTTFLWRVLG
ncbi:MAG TPA: hypothetical protein EYP78_01250 [Candidatus Omnitrophica bacterium]|nr:hypothetical protein [Candidatus Omnitrophota bacterium]